MHLETRGGKIPYESVRHCGGAGMSDWTDTTYFVVAGFVVLGLLLLLVATWVMEKFLDHL